MKTASIRLVKSLKKGDKMKDKISKIDKLEKNEKAQAIVNKASSGALSEAKSPKKAVRKPSKKPKTPKLAKAPKPAEKKADKGKAKTSFVVGSITGSSDKIAKIQAFFEKFAKNVEDKNDFIKAAILRHIKKHKKKK